MRTAVATYVYAAFLAATAFAALIVGVHDATTASGRLAVTVTSVLLVVVGVGTGIVAVALLPLATRGTPRIALSPRRHAVLLGGFLLIAVLGLYVFFAALGGNGFQRLVVIAVALALALAGFGGLRSFRRGMPVTAIRVEGAIALGVIGIVAGAAQFWFQNAYVPSHAGRAVALSVSLARLGERQGFHVVGAKIAFRDVGGSSVVVIGSAYTLTGSRVVRCHREATSVRVGQVFGGFLVDPQTSRYMSEVREERPSTVLAAGKFVGDGKRLDPDVSAGRDLVFFVPRGRYQLLRLRAQLFAIPASVQLSKGTLPAFTTFPGDNELYAFWRVDDDSWLHALLYGRARWVIVRYELVDPAHTERSQVASAFRATARFPEPSWHRGRPSATHVERLFAQPQPSESSEPFADTELPLDDVAEPGSRDPASCR